MGIGHKDGHGSYILNGITCDVDEVDMNKLILIVIPVCLLAACTQTYCGAHYGAGFTS